MAVLIDRSLLRRLTAPEGQIPTADQNQEADAQSALERVLSV